jgi:cell division protein FtsZ
MPSVEELPIVAQKEIRAQAGQVPVVGLAAQKKRVGFLERLANVGRTRKETDAEMPAKREPEFGQSTWAAPAPEAFRPQPQRAQAQPQAQPQPQAQARPQPLAQAAAQKGIRIERSRSEPAAVASVPKRIEAQPRMQAAEMAEAPAESVIEDDLEIPAFLRRRAN